MIFLCYNWQLQVNMQEEPPKQQERDSGNTFYTFTLSKIIRGWQDFLTVLRPARFDESLNHASEEEIEEFWMGVLKEMTKETEKVCLLVPVEIKVDPAKRVMSPEVGQESQEKIEAKGKGKKGKEKEKEKEKEVKVPLNLKVREVAMRLIDKSFPTLSYDLASLFLGNPKQLLIYRRCYSIESYIEKYRLPKDFKDKFGQLEYLTDEYYAFKIKRNRAISTFNHQLSQQLTNKIEKSEKDIKMAVDLFSNRWKKILEDFHLHTKCKQLILNSVGTELIEYLKPICEECNTYILPRYLFCETDQHKDVIVVKKGDPRLLPPEQLAEEQEEKKIVRYEYVQPPHEQQPPYDLRNCQFVDLNMKKQCFVYKFQFRRCESWNNYEGLFIRSRAGEENYELNVDLAWDCREIVVDIYPYRKGKIAYEIYIWNSAGFTKSTEELVIYNEMAVPGQNYPHLKDYKLYLLGSSTTGLKYCGGMEQSEPMLFGFNEKKRPVKRVSLGGAALICDAWGDVAAWGEMYYPSNDNENEVDLQAPPSLLRVETPFNLLSGRYVRKLSCGTSHYLMCTIFGAMYSMGLNQFGQLGLGIMEFEGPEAIQPQQVCKFTNSQSPFIIDILAGPGYTSFALNSQGQLYRWGFNQVEETKMEIRDRFGSIINYSATTIIYRCFSPFRVSSRYLPRPLAQIASGNNFHFALDITGTLYGWGVCKHLGIPQLLDSQERIVLDIVNPIQIMKNIKSITTGFDHAVAQTNDGRVIGWGDAASFSNSDSFTLLPVDMTEEYGNDENIVEVKAGKDYTAVLTTENTIHIHGKRHNFPQKCYDISMKIKEISCSHQSLIGLLVDSQ